MARSIGFSILVLVFMTTGRAHAEEGGGHHTSPHKGCKWWGVFAAAYSPRFNNEVAHELAAEVGAACVLELKEELELSLQPLLVPMIEFEHTGIVGAVAPAFNASLFWALADGAINLGPRVGASAPIFWPQHGEEWQVGASWHLGLEVERRLVKDHASIFFFLQYAGSWKEEHVANGPEAGLGVMFR